MFYSYGQSRSADSSKRASAGSFGSVAVAIVREDTIAVAAESRTITNGVVNPDTTCKITVVNNIVFAATGLLRGNNSAPGIVDYARDVLGGPGKTEDKLKTFQAGASNLLASWLDIPGFVDSVAISSDYRNQHSVHALFCFFSRGDPIVVEYSFTPSLAGRHFKVDGYYDSGVRKPGEIIWIGAMEQTDTLVRTQHQFSRKIQGLDAISAGRALIENQMQSTPRIVGGYIDIVLVTSKRAEWIQRKQNCD